MRTLLFSLVLLCAGATASQAQPSERDVRLYGFILFNGAYNADAATPVDIPVFAGQGEEGSFLMTARQSRFGVRFTETYAYTVQGAIELDLWGITGSAAAGGVTQSAPRMRLAYLSVALSERDEVLFGQYWAVTAPRHPTSLAHVSIPELSSSGNLWGRLPQVRYTRRSDGATFEAALLRPFSGEEAPSGTQADYLDAASYSRLPFLQARGAVTPGAAEVGVSAHLGRFDASEAEGGAAATYVLAADGSVTAGRFGLTGEAFVGQNDCMFFGLAGTKGEGAAFRSGRSAGGWAQASVRIAPPLQLNAGWGTEAVAEGRTNRTGFANALYTAPGLPLTLAAEVTHIRTTPAQRPTLTGTAFNVAARYSFGL